MTQISVRALVRNIVSRIVVGPREDSLNHKGVTGGGVGIGPHLFGRTPGGGDHEA